MLRWSIECMSWRRKCKLCRLRRKDNCDIWRKILFKGRMSFEKSWMWRIRCWMKKRRGKRGLWLIRRRFLLRKLMGRNCLICKLRKMICNERLSFRDRSKSELKGFRIRKILSLSLWKWELRKRKDEDLRKFRSMGWRKRLIMNEEICSLMKKCWDRKKKIYKKKSSSRNLCRKLKKEFELWRNQSLMISRENCSSNLKKLSFKRSRNMIDEWWRLSEKGKLSSNSLTLRFTDMFKMSLE